VVVQFKLSLIAAALCVAACADTGVSEVGSNWHTTSVMADGDWRDEVIYQIIVDRFADGDLNNDQGIVPYALGRYQGGDWQGIIDHLDYLQELGVTALWISPVVRNLETDSGFDAYHGYWQQDFDHVNPHFGDLAKLRELVRNAHARGMKVLLDVVVNDVAQLFFYDINGNGSPDDNIIGEGCAPQDLQNNVCTNPQITHINEYDPDFDPRGIQGYNSLGFSGPSAVVWLHNPSIDREPMLPGWGAGALDPSQTGVFQNLDWYHLNGRITNFNDRTQVLTGDFPGGLKDLKTENPDVRAALTAEFAKWIQAADFDGFRIDTVKHVEHEFWQYFTPRIHAYTAGTMDIPDTTVKLAPGQPVPNIPRLDVPKPNFFMFGEIFDGDDTLVGSYTMNQELDGAFYFPQKFAIFDRVFKLSGATQGIADQRMLQQTLYGATPNENGIGVAPQNAMVNFLDNHDVARFLFDKPSVPALRSALAYLLTEDGIPCIYYGTEQEFNGGDDPRNRERLWDTGFPTDGDTFQYMKRLIQIRKNYEPLRRGSFTIRWATTRVGTEQDAGIIAFERASGGHTVLVVINVSDTQQSQTSATSLGGNEMTTSFPAGTQLVDLLAPDGDPAGMATVDGSGGLTITVPARGAKIFVPTADVVH
jgi:glycosidase